MDHSPQRLQPVARPLATIFAAQTLMTSAAYGISVIAPDAAPALGLDPNSVGFLASTVYLLAMLTGLGSQTAIARIGPTRTFEWLLVFTALGVLALMAAHPLLAFIGAALIGIGAGPMNPTGSYVLSRVTPPLWQPFVFSLKQCGTPVGGMAAGAVLPPLALLYDWRLALALIPIGAIAIILLAPQGRLEASSDTPRDADDDDAASAVPIHHVVMQSVRDAFSTPALRAVVLIGIILGACQLGIAAYFVVYLWRDAGMSPIEAGRVFVVFHIAGIVARIVLGALAERFIATRHLLVILGVLMGVATALAARFGPDTALWWIIIVTVLLGASGNGWVGLFFSELARLAPGKVASITGGAQFAMYVGIFVGPLLYGVLLKSGLSHGECMAVFALLALTTAVMPMLANTARRAR